MRGVVGLVVLALANCVQSSSTQCDGFICPDKTVCDTVNGGCVLPEQLQTCVGMADNIDCNIGGQPLGFCKNGVCVESRCGDGVVRGSERCDGSNLDGQTCATLGYYSGGDVSCASDCLFETSSCGGGKCGDHIVQRDHEFCEDGVAPAELSCLDYGFDLGRIGCAPTCQPDFGACEHFGFFPVVTNTTGALRGVWARTPTDVYIANDGALRHFDGSDWTTIDLGSSVAVWDVHGTSANDIWAVGDQNTIFHFNGTAWTTMTLPGGSGTNVFYSVWDVAPDNVFIAGDDDNNLNMPGVLAHWNGTAWSVTQLDLYVFDVWGIGSDAFAVQETGIVLQWIANQWEATVVGTGQLQAVWGTGVDDVWAAGFSELHHRTATGWSTVTLPTNHNIVSITGAGNRVFFGCTDGVLMYDGGAYTLIPTSQFNWIWATSATDVWAVSPFGAVRRFTGRAWLDDGNTMTTARAIAATSATYAVAVDTASPTTTRVWDGATWTTLPTSPTNAVQGLYVAAPGDIFVAGFGASHYYNDGSGPSWHTTTGTSGTLTGMWGRNASDVFALGVAGRIYHWDGNTWSLMTSNTTTTLRVIWGTATEVFAAGGGEVLHYNGVAWAPMTLPPGTHFTNSIWGTSGSDVYIGGSGEIMHWDGASWSVQVSNLDFQVRAISGNGPTDIYAAGSLGAMVHFDGVSWSPVRVPTTQTLSGIAVTPTRVFLAGAEGTQQLLLP